MRFTSCSLPPHRLTALRLHCHHHLNTSTPQHLNTSSPHLSQCTSTAFPDPAQGIFDVSDDRNPYKAYTSIHVMYCSGDLHAGNVTRGYTDSSGNPIVQVGYSNTLATLDW